MAVDIDGKIHVDHGIVRGLHCNAFDIVVHRIVLAAVDVCCIVVAVDSHGVDYPVVVGGTSATLEDDTSLDPEFSWLMLEPLVACPAMKVETMIVVSM